MDLSAFERRIYSQNGEDGVIAEIFRRIGTGPRFAVEFGVGDGSECMTRCLFEQGWDVLQMDARAGPPPVKHERITAENVNALFAKYGVPHGLDLLVIDIDGNDFWVWKAIDNAYQPRLVVVEYNASIPPILARSVAYDPDLVWDGSTYFGASLLALSWLARAKGYDLVYCDNSGTNAFFVRSDVNDLPALTPTLAYREPRYGAHRPAARAMVEIGEDLNEVGHAPTTR